MADLAAAPSPPPTPVLPVLFVDGDRTVDLGTVTVQPSLGVKKLQALVADRVGVAPHQISATLARPRRARRVPLEEGADLAAAVAREGSGCYVLASLRRARRERRGGRARRDKHKASAADAAPPPEKTILKRLPPTDLASLVPPAAMFGGWDYEAQLRELQRQRDWYLMSTAAAADPYLLPLEDPPMWSPRPPCPECEAAAAAMLQPPFHWCVRDAVVTAGFRSHVGPIERPARKSPSPPPPPPSPGRLPGLLGMPVY
ncbi:uncharacterized protein LOC120642175 [Panicum virgatum]|uniref:DUF7138 domain-containing protein n=1 Tax=Panicum virgatum TaxID=38727 RepID=A0A8T0QS04_PANVG|nr:uncharacterized protein LOC120642175 [Panicum virgatum]KAG2575833.1 hypothetical protein PVAP13_7KG366300 [Panicum virgatum]